MTVLLDANVLIAAHLTHHVHHEVAEAWLANYGGRFATCPSTEGSLIRMLLRQGELASVALEVVRDLGRNSRHDFWPDDLPYVEVSLSGVIGHRQVTDAYLAQIARRRGGRLATFDQGLAKLHSDVAELVATRR